MLPHVFTSHFFEALQEVCMERLKLVVASVDCPLLPPSLYLRRTQRSRYIPHSQQHVHTRTHARTHTYVLTLTSNTWYAEDPFLRLP